ncbi:hypothetical protein QR721_03550 [Aciduricibacillus chroicocephali]|uniref:Lipoprotein n=1 Tax=Aciduricibacillus chroicocephali TaxID=3054939 RepID=A0ABY9KX13_9BACI|nr:hypothetical protein QR721_03550 [Bacillaceae bacterium 44XB]
MNRKVYTLLSVLLCAGLIAGCSSNDGSSKGTKDESSQNPTASKEKNSNDDNATNVQKETNDKQKQNENEQDQQKAANKNPGTKNQQLASDKSKDTESNQIEPKTLANTLKMNNSLVKRPTAFPVNGDVTTNVTKDTSSFYSVDYRTKADDLVATFSGIRFPSADAAAKDLKEFMNGKEVPKNIETATDLGYGIRGYSEGAAGHGYFGWEEGNWTFNITYITEDKLNSPAIAKEIVNYLEKHKLPAPKDKGIVAINYPQGANSVDVDIRWQENDMIYRLNTNKVPLDALSMAVSVK